MQYPEVFEAAAVMNRWKNRADYWKSRRSYLRDRYSNSRLASNRVAPLPDPGQRRDNRVITHSFKGTPLSTARCTPYPRHHTAQPGVSHIIRSKTLSSPFEGRPLPWRGRTEQRQEHFNPQAEIAGGRSGIPNGWGLPIRPQGSVVQDIKFQVCTPMYQGSQAGVQVKAYPGPALRHKYAARALKPPDQEGGYKDAGQGSNRTCPRRPGHFSHVFLVPKADGGKRPGYKFKTAQQIYGQKVLPYGYSTRCKEVYPPRRLGG